MALGATQLSRLTLVKNPLYHKINKHIDTRYHSGKEHVTKIKGRLHYVKSQDQITGNFKKALAIGIMISLLEGRKLGLREDVEY